jgi:hypothetical protein
MIIIFIDQIKEVIPNAEKALSFDEFLLFGQLIHKIKPSIEGMGMYSIRDDIRLLEKISQESAEKDNIRNIFFQIKRNLFKAIEQLKQEI